MKLIKRIIDEIVFWRHFKLNPCDIYGEQVATVATVNDDKVEIGMQMLTNGKWAVWLRGSTNSYSTLIAEGTFRDCKKFYKRMWLKNVGIGRKRNRK